MMDIIRRDDAFMHGLYTLTHNAFKEGMVPLSIEEFKDCINNQTTDGSPCFANTFGKGEDDTAMLFFYPFYCAVPPRYQRNLRSSSPNKMGMLHLEYQQMMADFTTSVDYLEQLLSYMEESLEYSKFSIQMQLSGTLFRDDKISEQELLEGVEQYKLKYDEVVAKITDKIVQLKAQESEDFV